jgi:phage host-nuclease inhibitor protein Gam
MMTNLSSSLIPARTNHYHRTRNCSQLRAKMATGTRTKRNNMATGIFSWEILTPAVAGQISQTQGKTIFEMGVLHLPEEI